MVHIGYTGRDIHTQEAIREVYPPTNTQGGYKGGIPTIYTPREAIREVYPPYVPREAIREVYHHIYTPREAIKGGLPPYTHPGRL